MCINILIRGRNVNICIYVNTNRGRSILTYNIQYINVQKSTPIQFSKNNNSQIPIYYYPITNQSPFFFDKHPWAYKIPPPFPHSYINYNQPLNDVPKPEGKFYWERGRRPLKLLPAVMGAMFFLGGPVKIIDGKIPILTFGVKKLQIVSE